MKPNGSHPSNYFMDWQRMSDLLSDLHLYTPLQAHEWLLAKQKALGDQSPAQLIAAGRTVEVEQLIARLEGTIA
jgi:hypothetical protein